MHQLYYNMIKFTTATLRASKMLIWLYIKCDDPELKWWFNQT